MRKLTMFHFEGCPYCREARRLIGELTERYPELRAVEIDMIDEKKRPEVASEYDYWYVPTFFLGQEKLHEGACDAGAVERVLRRALKAE